MCACVIIGFKCNEVKVFIVDYLVLVFVFF